VTTKERLAMVQSMASVMDEDTYCRALVEVASEFLQIELDWLECVKVLNMVPNPDWFESPAMRTILKNDPLFRAIVEQMIDKLYMTDVLPGKPQNVFQAPGQA